MQVDCFPKARQGKLIHKFHTLLSMDVARSELLIEFLESHNDPGVEVHQEKLAYFLTLRARMHIEVLPGKVDGVVMDQARARTGGMSHPELGRVLSVARPCSRDARCQRRESFTKATYDFFLGDGIHWER